MVAHHHCICTVEISHQGMLRVLMSFMQLPRPITDGSYAPVKYYERAEAVRSLTYTGGVDVALQRRKLVDFVVQLNELSDVCAE